MATRLFTLIICTYNRAKYLGITLDALASQTLPPENYRLLIVDNNSTDETMQVVQSYQGRLPHMEYIFEPQQGLSHARNRGMSEADTPYQFYLDDDAIPAPDALANLQKFLLDNPDVYILGGRAIIKYLNGKPAWVTPKVEAWMGCYDYGDKIIEVTPANIKAKKVRLPIGCCFIVKSSLLEEVGGFKPSLGRVGKKMLAGEETLIALKALEQKGRIVYHPGVFVDHMIEPHWVDQKFLLNKTYFYGISDTYVQFLSGKPMPAIAKYMIFRLIFLAKNIVDLTISAIRNCPQRKFEVGLLYNFNRGVYAGLFERMRSA